MKSWMGKNYQKHLQKEIIIKDDLPYKIIETYYKITIIKLKHSIGKQVNEIEPDSRNRCIRNGKKIIHDRTAILIQRENVLF